MPLNAKSDVFVNTHSKITDLLQSVMDNGQEISLFSISNGISQHALLRKLKTSTLKNAFIIIFKSNEKTYMFSNVYKAVRDLSSFDCSLLNIFTNQSVINELQTIKIDENIIDEILLSSNFDSNTLRTLNETFPVTNAKISECSLDFNSFEKFYKMISLAITFNVMFLSQSLTIYQ